MRITAVKPILCDQFLLVRVATDAGLTGTGEAGLWASHEVVARAVESLAEYFVGKDPALIEHPTKRFCVPATSWARWRAPR